LEWSVKVLDEWDLRISRKTYMGLHPCRECLSIWGDAPDLPVTTSEIQRFYGTGLAPIKMEIMDAFPAADHDRLNVPWDTDSVGYCRKIEIGLKLWCLKDNWCDLKHVFPGYACPNDLDFNRILGDENEKERG
jgi:hypothetical protein